MNTHALSLFIGSAYMAVGASGQVWINEFHYDNSGTDSAEFVEIVAPTSLTDLASVRLTLYNGGDGRSYGSAHALNSFTPGVTVSGLKFYSKLIPGLQNGAPDGLSLDIGGAVVQFISYEGGFTAANGPANGITSTGLSVAESEATAVGTSLGLVGLGRNYPEFTWAAGGLATPGAPNDGQAIIPEPRHYLLGVALGLAAFSVFRRGRAPVPGGAGRAG